MLFRTAVVCAVFSEGEGPLFYALPRKDADGDGGGGSAAAEEVAAAQELLRRFFREDAEAAPSQPFSLVRLVLRCVDHHLRLASEDFRSLDAWCRGAAPFADEGLLSEDDLLLLHAMNRWIARQLKRDGGVGAVLPFLSALAALSYPLHLLFPYTNGGIRLYGDALSACRDAVAHAEACGSGMRARHDVVLRWLLTYPLHSDTVLAPPPPPSSKPTSAAKPAPSAAKTSIVVSSSCAAKDGGAGGGSVVHYATGDRAALVQQGELVFAKWVFMMDIYGRPKGWADWAARVLEPALGRKPPPPPSPDSSSSSSTSSSAAMTAAAAKNGGGSWTPPRPAGASSASASDVVGKGAGGGKRRSGSKKGGGEGRGRRHENRTQTTLSVKDAARDRLTGFGLLVPWTVDGACGAMEVLQARVRSADHLAQCLTVFCVVYPQRQAAWDGLFLPLLSLTYAWRWAPSAHLFGVAHAFAFKCMYDAVRWRNTKLFDAACVVLEQYPASHFSSHFASDMLRHLDAHEPSCAAWAGLRSMLRREAGLPPQSRQQKQQPQPQPDAAMDTRVRGEALRTLGLAAQDHRLFARRDDVDPDEGGRHGSGPGRPGAAKRKYAALA